MENFNHKEYRDNLAKDIRSEPDHQKRQEILNSEKQSYRYNEALFSHNKDKEEKRMGLDKEKTEKMEKLQEEVFEIRKKLFDKMEEMVALFDGKDYVSKEEFINKDLQEKSPEEVREFVRGLKYGEYFDVTPLGINQGDQKWIFQNGIYELLKKNPEEAVDVINQFHHMEIEYRRLIDSLMPNKIYYTGEEFSGIDERIKKEKGE